MGLIERKGSEWHICLYVCVCVCVCVRECRCTSANQPDVCVAGSCLETTDFDSALDLLHTSQSDALGAAKVCLS